MAKVRDSGMPPENMWATFFEPATILSQLMIDGATDAVEFGCGYGTFTIPAAGLVGGTLFAFDIEPDMIAATGRKADAAGVANVIAAQRDFVTDGTGLPAASADYAMLFNILHAVDPLALLREASRVLRPGGRVAVIHWNPTDTPRGPSLDIRPTPSQCHDWMIESGFRVVLGPTSLPPYHFGLVGERAF